MGNWYISPEEIMETKRMFEEQDLDVRTITMGINLLDCVSPSLDEMKRLIHAKLLSLTSKLKDVATSIEEDYRIPIVNRRISITPISLLLGSLDSIKNINLNRGDQAHTSIYASRALIPVVSPEAISDCLEIAKTLDRLAKEVNVDFLGGFSALVHKGYTRADLAVMQSLPSVLSQTERVCSSINLGTTKAGLNMNAVQIMGEVIHEIAVKTQHQNSIGCGKLVVFANAVEDNPFMAGAFHGVGEPDCCINVGVSGPGVIRNVVKAFPDADLDTLSEQIKNTAFKITRVGQLVAQEAAKRLHVPFGIVDLSLAPTNRPNDSVAGILEEMGIEMTGAPGTTAALALLTDAVKKGGQMATSSVGGMSGAFIPVSEDTLMSRAAEQGALSIEKLEAMTSVCSVGLDMVCIPGSTSPTTLSGILADECMIGIINNKTTGVRVIPVIGKEVGEKVVFGGLLGESVIMPVKTWSCAKFIQRKGRIPAPIHSLRN